MTKIDPERLILDITKVASLPDIYLKVGEAIKDPTTSNRDLENILSDDTAMAARILRISNSVLYNFPRKIETISNAITIIGHDQLEEVLLACSVVRMFKNIPQNRVNMDQAWLHSLSCATAARLIANQRREHNIERFYTAGLLHDIGRLIMYMELPEVSTQILEQCAASGELLFKVEYETLGFTHADLGALLLESWRLPERAIAAVGYHHKPGLCREFPVEAATIHVADIICNAMDMGSTGERFVPPLESSAWDTLQLDVAVVGTILDQLELQVRETRMLILGDDDD